jgi:hypothetical protein
MKRTLFLVACLATLLAVVRSSAGAVPGLSVAGTFTVSAVPGNSPRNPGQV